MNPQIASIENLIAADPGGRNVFGLVVADQLRLAAQSLRLAKRVVIVSGFFVPEAGAGETDGPPGAKVVGLALEQLGIEVDHLTDKWNAGLFRVLGIEPIVDGLGPSEHADGGDIADGKSYCAYLDEAHPTHLLSVERVGRGADGRYRNMRGVDVTSTTSPLDGLFLEASRRGLTTIGIGDGGNEIGMGKVFVDVLDTADPTMAVEHRAESATAVSTDFCIAAGVSNWGAYGLAGALSVLVGRDLLPSAVDAARDIERLVHEGGAVDGVTQRREPTVDGLDLAHSIRMLENIRRLITPSPLQQGKPLRVGVLGYGETGRAAANLLARTGHAVCVSDEGGVTVDPGTVLAGVETRGHTIDFLGDCDLVVASPGVRADAEIRDELHIRGIPVLSEMELAFQLGGYFGPRGLPDNGNRLIAVTGTVGKRTTVELIQHLFSLLGRHVSIGGNRGRPLSALLLDKAADRSERPAGADGCTSPKGEARSSAESVPDSTTLDSGAGDDLIAVAVSSFQLETVVHFRPHVAIMLNIDEAHLDRHRTVAEYVRTKARIFMNHRPDDILVLTFDDPRLRPLARKHQGRTLFVSSRQAVDRGAWLLDGIVRMNVDGTVEEIGRAAPPLPENLLASLVTARILGFSAAEIASVLRNVCPERSS